MYEFQDISKLIRLHLNCIILFSRRASHVLSGFIYLSEISRLKISAMGGDIVSGLSRHRFLTLLSYEKRGGSYERKPGDQVHPQ